LSLEFQALLDLKNSLKFVIKVTEDNRRKQTEVNKEICKVKLAEGDQVKKGMFGGKMSKEERIKDLEDQLKEVNLY
jgi:hypothetical protein